MVFKHHLLPPGTFSKGSMIWNVGSLRPSKGPSTAPQPTTYSIPYGADSQNKVKSLRLIVESISKLNILNSSLVRLMFFFKLLKSELKHQKLPFLPNVRNIRSFVNLFTCTSLKDHCIFLEATA